MLYIMHYIWYLYIAIVVLAEKYRDLHLKNNKEYPQFIVGPDIAMLRVDVLSARICNINDEVIKWNVGSESKKLTSQASQQF